ncbi:MAG: polyphosphate kinase 1 [Candidatus Omnitrophica bacterium]|nr:polyphosphate kinase 1 [Candidatus Omnitrophota bacterium]
MAKQENNLIHRDLSWLQFNQRILDEARDEKIPLIERLKFIAICANNLDEFFMVRVAALRRLLDSSFNQKDAFGYTPHELFSEIYEVSENFISQMYKTYQDSLSKELLKNRIFIKKYLQLNREQESAVKRYFDNTLYPIITPMAVDEGHPFPVLLTKTTAFGVYLNHKEKLLLAIIPIPKAVPRLFKLPSEKDEFSYILIDDIIRENLNIFFRGYTILGSFAFRIIRDSELILKEDFSSNLLKAIEAEVQKRPTAKVVSLQVEKNYHPELLKLLYQGIDFPQDPITYIDGDLDLTYLFELVNQNIKPNLTYRSYIPAKAEYENIFDKIKEEDFMLHLPYQSFQPTIDLLQAAAKDKDVLAIKMTLYRSSKDSAIIKSLIEAGKNNKQVTVLVEIKARFDEENNISWTKELEAAGCHVIYGFTELKIHAKIALIVRREENGIRRYVHISSGNYNEKTSQAYTDLGYFTCNDDVARDISDLFNVITGYSLPVRAKRIVTAPADLRNYFFELINKEIAFNKKYKNGSIIAKMNSLEDQEIINKLYEASAAGVKIKLIVRGICCLIPGRTGVSENIEVKSVVGRFLEHSRLYHFNNNGTPRTFISSADWMRRNFDNRIELLFEVANEKIKQDLAKILEWYWEDTAKSHYLSGDCTYRKSEAASNGNDIHEKFIKFYSA